MNTLFLPLFIYDFNWSLFNQWVRVEVFTKISILGILSSLSTNINNWAVQWRYQEVKNRLFQTYNYVYYTVPNWGMFECDFAHRRSVAVLCRQYKIRCNPMHPLNDALLGPYVPVRVTRGALVAHRNTYEPPRCRTSQYRRSIVFPLSVPLERSCWPRIRWWGTGGFQEQG